MWRVSSSDENSSAHLLPRRDRINPTDGMGVVATFTVDLEKLIQILKPNGFHLDKWTFDGLHLELEAQNNARKPEPADCRPEQIRLGLSVAGDDLTRCREKGYLPNMVSKCAVDMMVFSMDVIG